MAPYNGGETTGFMSPARDYLDQVIDLTDILDLRRASRYLVRVSGNDLEGRGIRDGDRLVVDATARPEPGNVAVVFAEGEAFLVEIVRDVFGREVLRAGMRELRPTETEIWAVATALVRLAP